jgi:hypothetical protein
MIELQLGQVWQCQNQTFGIRIRLVYDGSDETEYLRESFEEQHNGGTDVPFDPDLHDLVQLSWRQSREYEDNTDYVYRWLRDEQKIDQIQDAWQPRVLLWSPDVTTI